jgi:hypothetical protein
LWLQLTRAVVIACAIATTAHAGGETPTTLGFDTLLYTDDDNVVVSSSSVSAAANLDDEGSEVHAKVLVDAVTAASVDVISAATPRFTEAREELDLGGSKARGAWLPSLHYRLSREPDYLSNGGGARVQRRLGPDTTAEAGYDLTYDLVRRSGTPAEVFEQTLVTHAGDVSVSQVIDPSTVVRLAYSFTAQDGYLEKPYRFVPLFDEAGLAAAAADHMTLGLDTVGRYRLPERPAEEVPDRRLRHAIAARAVRWIGALDASLRADYRLYLDDWGVRSHTGELGITFERDAHALTISNRLYEQTAADFWRRTYVVMPGTVPRYRTVDRDLSHFVGDTAEAAFRSRYERWSWYASAGAMYTRYFDYLFLQSRIALMMGGGVQVDL